MAKTEGRGSRRSGLILFGLLVTIVALAWTYTSWDSPVHTVGSTRTCGSVHEPFFGSSVNVTYTDGTKAFVDNGCSAALDKRSSSLKIGLLVAAIGVPLAALGVTRRRTAEVTIPEDWLTNRDDDPLRH